MPGEEQPQLSKPLGIVAKASEEDKPRGQLELLIMSDGSVQGHWGGQYRISKYVDYQVMGCQFKGLVDPEEVYSDDEGEDPSKLFFISKGPFSILETNDDNGKVRSLGGHIYVRGWLSLDNSIDGEIILTNDEQNFYLYTWNGKCEEGGLSLF